MHFKDSAAATMPRIRTARCSGKLHKDSSKSITQNSSSDRSPPIKINPEARMKTVLLALRLGLETMVRRSGRDNGGIGIGFQINLKASKTQHQFSRWAGAAWSITIAGPRGQCAIRTCRQKQIIKALLHATYPNNKDDNGTGGRIFDHDKWLVLLITFQVPWESGPRRCPDFARSMVLKRLLQQALR